MNTRLALLFAAAVSLTATANAAVVFRFENVGSDLVATVSGSLDLTGLTRIQDNITGTDVGMVGSLPYSFGGFDANFTPGWGIGYLYPSSQWDGYTGGSLSTTLLGAMTLPNFYSGPFFWMRNDAVLVPPTTALNGIADYSTAYFFQWTGRSVSGFFGNALTTTPVTVWNNPNAAGDSGAIQFALAVPEATSSSMMLMAAGLIPLRRRKR